MLNYWGVGGCMYVSVPPSPMGYIDGMGGVIKLYRGEYCIPKELANQDPPNYREVTNSI